MKILRLGCITLICALAGCGTGNPINGNWNGTVANHTSAEDAFTFTVTLNESNNTLTVSNFSITSTNPTFPCYTNPATVTGTFTPASGALVLNITSGSTAYYLQGDLTGGSISGLGGGGCGSPFVFTMSKQ